MEIGSHFFGLRIIPLAQFGNQLKQPGKPIRALKAGASCSPKICGLLREVFCCQALPQSLASRLHERGVGKCPDQANQEPVSVNRRVPIVATVECWREFPRRSDIGIAGQGVADVIWVLLVDAGESQIRKPLGCFHVEHGRAGMFLSASLAHTPYQEEKTENAFHSQIL